VPDVDTLTQLKATTPERLSVQSRATDSPFAPTSDVSGAGLFWVQLGNQLDEEPQWNAIYPHWRDIYLQRFARQEPMLASAVYSMATRISTLNYQVNGPPRAKKFASELLTRPGLGDSLNALIQKCISDLHTSDNGAFIELWRAGNPLSDAKNRPVLGFAQLDSRQCWRSFDPEYPVWYTNPVTHEIRKIHASRIAFTSDNPQPTELARGIGFCATSRVLRMTRVFKNMQIFLDEKVGGRFNRAIGAVSGVTPKQLKQALEQNDAQADNKGFVVYKDIPFLVSPNLEKGNEIKLMLQDLASIPDGFVFRDDADLYAYILAFAFGVDAREFWPATSSGATKADATVQNMKARGRGIGNDIALMEGLIRQALPESVSFEFDFTDDDQDRATAEIHQLQANTLKTFFDMGALNAQQIQALGIAHGILDAEIMATNSQPLTSDDNPDTPDNAPDVTTEDYGAPDTNNSNKPTQIGKPNQPPQQQPAVKSFDDYRRSVRSLTRGYWNGELSRFDFVDGMVSAIDRHFEQAWQEVEKQYSIAPDERTESSQDRLDLAVNTEISYITGFADAIEEGSQANGGALQPLMDRAELWANGYERTLELAQTIVGSDKKFRWVRDPQKASCADCIQYDGLVFFGSQWDAAGVRPKGEMLECGGFNCGCVLEETPLPRTRGSVPPLVGRKGAIIYINKPMDLVAQSVP
jgi:hypothetical protein